MTINLKNGVIQSISILQIQERLQWITEPLMHKINLRSRIIQVQIMFKQIYKHGHMALKFQTTFSVSKFNKKLIKEMGPTTMHSAIKIKPITIIFGIKMVTAQTGESKFSDRSKTTKIIFATK